MYFMTVTRAGVCMRIFTIVSGAV